MLYLFSHSVYKNLFFSLAHSGPTMSSSTNDTNFTPSMFYATPDQDGYYGPIDTQTPIAISSDDDN